MLRVVRRCVAAFLICGTALADDHQAEVVVYGDATGGVTAAVQAAHMGKKVILVSQYGHLGGLSREFYHQAYLHYQKEGAWNHEPRSKYKNQRQGPGMSLDPKANLPPPLSRKSPR